MSDINNPDHSESQALEDEHSERVAEAYAQVFKPVQFYVSGTSGPKHSVDMDNSSYVRELKEHIQAQAWFGAGILPEWQRLTIQSDVLRSEQKLLEVKKFGPKVTVVCAINRENMAQENDADAASKASITYLKTTTGNKTIFSEIKNWNEYIGTSQYNKGKLAGVEGGKKGDKKVPWYRIRVDFDPDKLFHFNLELEDSSKNNAYIIRPAGFHWTIKAFRESLNVYETYLTHLQTLKGNKAGIKKLFSGE